MVQTQYIAQNYFLAILLLVLVGNDVIWTKYDPDIYY